MDTPTRRFKRQHRELQAMAQALIRLSLAPRSDAREIRRELARFAGKLRVHATMETDALYPTLLASTDDRVRRKTERLHGELAGLYGAFDIFEERWPDAETIDAHRIRFRLDLVRMMAVLARRMMKENRELYPMADEALG